MELYGRNSNGDLIPVMVTDDGKLKVNGDSASGGSGSDRELVVTTYLVKTAFTGASVNDTVTCTQVLDVTGAPVTISTIWRNQTTGADLASTPSAVNLSLLASTALTDVQLRASAVAVSSADLGTTADAAATTDTGSFSLISLFKRLLGKLPASLGIKAASASLSIAPASDAVFATGGVTTNPTASAMTRPATATTYASGQLIANSASAGSVTPISLTVTRVAAGSAILRRLRLRKSSNVTANATFRVHLFSAAPTVSVADAGTFSTGVSGVGNYIGRADITTDQALSDGAWGCSDATFTDIGVKLGAGQVVYALIEARAAYSSVASEGFVLSADVLQD